MRGLVGYMARIADEVALYETTRKQAESEPIRSNEIDLEVLTDQCFNGPSLPHNQRSAEDVSFSQSLFIKELALDGEFNAMNALVINDRWLRGVEIPLRFALRIAVRHFRRRSNPNPSLLWGTPAAPAHLRRGDILF